MDAELNVPVWIGVGLAGVVGLMFVFFVATKFQKSPQVRNFFDYCYSSLADNVVIRRRYWNSVSWIEAILLICYFGINATVLGVVNIEQLMLRSGEMAAINIIPLFLGGRTSVIANFLGIPLHTYYLLHHWVGRIAVAQAVLHSGLAIAQMTGGKMFISGLIMMILLVIILVASLHLVRRLAYETFLKSHLFLALITLPLLFWHVFPLVYFPSAAAACWALNASYQYYSLRWGKITVTEFRDSHEVLTAIELKLVSRALPVRPGQYFYLLPSGKLSFWERIQAHPFMVTWWETPDNTSQSQEAPPDEKDVKISFIIQPRRGLSSRLKRDYLTEVGIYGPYGQDLLLERFENVILVAQGIGISGILPYALHLVDKRHHIEPSIRRSMLSRKLDIYWVLEESCNEKWVLTKLEYLLKKDNECMLQIWGYFPSKPPPLMKPEAPVENPDTVEESTHPEFKAYKRIYGQVLTIPEAIKIQTRRSAGKSIVVACGDCNFIKSIRNSVRNSTTFENTVRFTEVEFRPPTNPKMSTMHKYLGKPRDLELQPVREVPRGKPVKMEAGVMGGLSAKIITLEEDVDDNDAISIVSMV